ncbi:TolC family protein [Nitrosophilus kaiyonis]|uniref:TolC family protein n=1 Tax=Nitrosophilus kaiyonis TaxID=2930200 RepID=UPI002492694B|nr:TolC family protein [Nitrosophilus kaiyonis]
MKKLLIFSLVGVLLNASELSELFKELKKKPVTKIDEELVKITKLKKQKVIDELYPSINLFATYEHYTKYTNLRPVPPPEANSLIAHKEALPFAKDIRRVGASFDMPLFVKELFTLQDKLNHIIKSAEYKKNIDIYKNEAIILASYANLNYLKELENTLIAREKSLNKTYEDLKIKVDSGRAAPIALDKIESAIDSIKITLQKIKTNETLAKEKIASLVGREPKNITKIEQINSLNTNSFYTLKPLKEQLNAAKYDLKAKKEKFLPKLFLSGKYTQNYADEDVMFDKSINTGYGNILLKLVIPISKSKFTDIEISKRELIQKNENLIKTQIELKAKAKSLKNQLKIYKNMQKIAHQKVKRQKELLRYAKTAFDVERITEEEYLRYEDNLLQAQAELSQIKAKYWQTLAQLAVIYGNDLERIVK